MADATPNVYAKIAQVMASIGAVERDSRHGQGFQYQSMEAVTSAIRGRMADAGLIMLSECVGSQDTGSQWVCDYRFTFISIDDGSSHSLSWQQATPHKDGKDDKAMGKNHTYAQKYFLLRTFLISSKDDVDADANDFGGEQAFKPKVVRGSKNNGGNNLSSDDDKVWNMVKAVFGNDRAKFDNALSFVDVNLSDNDKARELVAIAKGA